MKITALILGTAMAAGTAGAALCETPTLRITVLSFGTVNWELDTIRHYGLDAANGFELDINGVASGTAGEIAFQGGETDMIVSDWLWVARQRAAGRDYAIIPYSKAVGGLLVPGDSEAETIADLAGGTIGVAGDPLDKSWLIMRAYAEQRFGMDLQTETEQSFGAPPLIYKTAVRGDMDAALNYWHYTARMEAEGMRRLVDVVDASEALGLDPETPLLGYVVHGEMLADSPELIAGFAAASRRAKEILADDDAAWERLRERMNADTQAQFEALKAGFRAGIPGSDPVDEGAVDRMLKLMADLGGEALVGPLESLPDGVFADLSS